MTPPLTFQKSGSQSQPFMLCPSKIGRKPVSSSGATGVPRPPPPLPCFCCAGGGVCCAHSASDRKATARTTRNFRFFILPPKGRPGGLPHLPLPHTYPIPIL